MHRRTLALVALLAVAADRPPAEKITPLPAVWDGVWKGVCQLETADGKKPQEVPMELHVGDLAGGKKTWKIVYGSGERRQTRPYELAPVAGKPGRFVIDEKNGLLIDYQLLGDRLYGAFTIGDSVVMARFERQGDGLHVELSVFTTADPRKTKLTGGKSEVASYRLTTVQRGVLKREKAN